MIKTRPLSSLGRTVSGSTAANLIEDRVLDILLAFEQPLRGEDFGEQVLSHYNDMVKVVRIGYKKIEEA